MNSLIHSVNIKFSQPDVADKDESTPNSCNYERIEKRPDESGATRVIWIRFIQKYSKGVDKCHKTKYDGKKDLINKFKIVVGCCSS